MVHIFAYIDPGVGTLIWQSVAAAFIGSMFYVRRFLGKFRTRDKEKHDS